MYLQVSLPNWASITRTRHTDCKRKLNACPNAFSTPAPCARTRQRIVKTQTPGPPSEIVVATCPPASPADLTTTDFPHQRQPRARPAGWCCTHAACRSHGSTSLVPLRPPPILPPPLPPHLLKPHPLPPPHPPPPHPTTHRLPAPLSRVGPARAPDELHLPPAEAIVHVAAAAHACCAPIHVAARTCAVDAPSVGAIAAIRGGARAAPERASGTVAPGVARVPRRCSAALQW